MDSTDVPSPSAQLHAAILASTAAISHHSSEYFTLTADARSVACKAVPPASTGRTGAAAAGSQPSQVYRHRRQRDEDGEGDGGGADGPPPAWLSWLGVLLCVRPRPGPGGGGGGCGERERERGRQETLPDVLGTWHRAQEQAQARPVVPVLKRAPSGHAGATGLRHLASSPCSPLDGRPQRTESGTPRSPAEINCRLIAVSHGAAASSHGSPLRHSASDRGAWFSEPARGGGGPLDSGGAASDAPISVLVAGALGPYAPQQQQQVAGAGSGVHASSHMVQCLSQWASAPVPRVADRMNSRRSVTFSLREAEEMLAASSPRRL